MDTVCTLYRSFQEGTGPSTGGLMDRTKDAAGGQAGVAAGDASLPRPCHKHMSATERLRKVIQELADTEKSYVKVRPPPPLFPISCLPGYSSGFYSSPLSHFHVFLQDLSCLFEIYLKPLQNETFLTQDEVGVGVPGHDKACPGGCRGYVQIECPVYYPQVTVMNYSRPYLPHYYCRTN